MKPGRGFVAILLLAVVTFASTSMADSEKDKRSAIEAAQGWLKKVDKGQYADTWKEAAAFFKKAVTQDQWIAAMNQSRKPLGKTLKRKMLGAKPMTDLPNAPKGDYVVIQFSTDFSSKKGAVETITPMKEKDGTWRVSGYYIK
jgi:uncharacterized protein YcnI